MKNSFLLVLLMLLSLSVLAQAQFDSNLDNKKLTLYNLQGVQNLKVDIEITDKNASVLITIYLYSGGSSTNKVENSSIQHLSTQGVEKIEISHQNKFIFRYKQRLKDEAKSKPRSKKRAKRSKSNRVRVSSGSSGNTTSTTVEST